MVWFGVVCCMTDLLCVFLVCHFVFSVSDVQRWGPESGIQVPGQLSPAEEQLGRRLRSRSEVYRVPRGLSLRVLSRSSPISLQVPSHFCPVSLESHLSPSHILLSVLSSSSPISLQSSLGLTLVLSHSQSCLPRVPSHIQSRPTWDQSQSQSCFTWVPSRSQSGLTWVQSIDKWR